MRGERIQHRTAPELDMGIVHDTCISTLALVLAFGCKAATGGPEAGIAWRPLDDAAPFEVARTACRKKAFAKTVGMRNDDTATKAAAGVFVACMRERGWVSAQAPE
jgi:hypothetical protein